MGCERLVRAALVAAIVAGGSAAAAPEPASLQSPGAGELREASASLDVRFRGLVVEVTARHVLVNPGERDELAIYTFTLPRDAAVTGLAIELPDRPRREALAIDADAAIRAIPRAAVTEGEPDVGLLRMVSRTESHATYELRVFPIPGGESVEVAIDWAAPLALRDGRLSLRVPGRGDALELARERVSWRAEPPAGARGIEGAYARGAAVELDGQRARDGEIPIATISAPVSGDLVLEIVPAFAGDTPGASHGVYPIGDSAMAVAGWAYHPRGAGRDDGATAPKRLLLIADVSRSMGAEGLSRSAAIAEALLDASDTPEIDVITFDRRPRAVFDAWRADGEKSRDAIRRALVPASPRNGTDLVAALERARSRIEGDAPPDLVVIISDDVWPSTQSAAAAKRALGRRALATAPILAISLLPDAAAAPAAGADPLTAIAHASGGLASTLRHGEGNDRAPHLVSQLSSPRALVSARYQQGSRRFEPLALPDALAAGDGALESAFARGRGDPELALVARRGDDDLRIRSERSEVLDRLAFPLAAVASDLTTLLPLAPADTEAPDPESRALRALLQAALDAPVITPHTSLVIPSPDAYGSARADAARSFGPWLYRRVPPPPERDRDHELRAFQSQLSTSSKTPYRPTGKLTRASIKRSLAASMPRIRHCYRRALRRDVDLEGSLTLVVELGRGEVLAARAEDIEGLPDSLADCAARAAYAMRIPRVGLGDEPEPRITARYPLEFRSGGVRGVRLELPGPGAPSLDAADPLGGLPEAR